MAVLPQALPPIVQRDFNLLPGWQSPFFSRLWTAGKLTCADAPGGLDPVDELNGRLVCAAIAGHERLLIGLPDSRISRRSAILATGLIKTFVHASEKSLAGGNVLYFGSRIGIRTQLEHAYLSGKRVTTFFQTTCTKGSLERHAKLSGPLPRLHCVYSPVDPVALVNQVKPAWVAIDCDDSTELQWLRSLLTCLAERRIPAIAWSSNPLSTVHQDFTETRGKRFVWPLRILCQPMAIGASQIVPVDVVLAGEIMARDIVPCEITGKEADDFATLVHRAEIDLSRGIRTAKGRLSQDGFLVAYRLLRLLERMPVPLASYEANCGRYWGLSSIAGLSGALSKFVEALQSHEPKIAGLLRSAQSAVGAVHSLLQEQKPPLWNALIDLCIEDNPRDSERLLVFNSDSHARMFMEAMATQEGTPADALREMHVHPMSLTAMLRRLNAEKSDDLPLELQLIAPRHKRPWATTVIGLPSDKVYRRIAPVLATDSVEVLHYPHQRTRLTALIEYLNEALLPSADDWSSTLAVLAGRQSNGHARATRERRFRLAAAREIQGRGRSHSQFTPSEPLWQGGSTLDALQLLFAGDDGANESRDVLPLHNDADNDAPSTGDPITVAKAMKLTFAGGWIGLFSMDQRLNFIGANEDLKQKPARLAAAGDRVLYILGHQQQSLYDLVVSRVHHDPEIKTHLDYIGNWQREARAKFSEWTRSGKSLDDLYAGMVQRGTKIQSGLAIWNWCEGLTLRPRDKEDLLRLSGILEMPFTRQCYQQIHRAGDRIHGLHIQLSLRLRSWIQQGAVSTDMRDEVIDEAAGLTFGDIQDALLIVKVVEASEVIGPFYCQTLGTIERSSNA